MTVSPEFFAWAKRFLIGLSDKPWYTTHSTSYQISLPRPVQGKPRRRIHIIDAPMWLYEFGNPLPGAVYPKTFVQLVDSMAKKLEFYLTDDLVEGLVFLCDDLPPEAKQSTSERAPTEDTLPTPLELVAELVNSEHDRRIEAWVRWTQQPDRRVTGMRETNLSSSTSVAQKRFDFTLPLWEPSEKSNPELFKKVQSGEVKGPFMADYLKNPDFKRMLYKKILEGLIERVIVPFWHDNEGKQRRKWVVMQGTAFAKVLFPNHETGNINNELKIDYREADTVIGHYMRLWRKQFDVVIESTDGDFVMCALLAMDDCVKHHTTLIKNVGFEGRVYQVRFRWRDVPTQLFDICELWKAVHNTFAAMAVAENIEFENPVGTFVALSALLGNDYVKNYPQIGSSRLFKGVLRNAQEIFASGDLVHNNWKDPAYFTVNWETFKRLTVAVYSECVSLDLDITKPDTAIAKLAAKGNAASKNGFSMALVRRTYANLTWCLRYFSTAGQARLVHPNEFATDAAKRSIYGYVKNKPGLDKYGRADVSFADDAAIESIPTS